MRLYCFLALAILVLAQAAMAIPSFMGYSGINRVVSAKPLEQGGIAFGVMAKYWASTNEIDGLVFRTYTPEYPAEWNDTLDVADKEHYADGYFVVGYGVTDFLELGARLSYVLSWYERDMVQPRGLYTGRWDGVDGLGDLQVGMKLGFTPTSDTGLLWLGLQNWWSFAPNTNDLALCEDYCGRWFDDQPMYEMRRPFISTGHTSYGIGSLITFDLADISPSAPLRFHSNIGYSHYKQTFDMTDFRYNYTPDSVYFYDSTEVALDVEDNVLDIGFGMEFPTQYAIVFVEYSLKECLDRNGQNSVAYLTPGLRFITRSGAFMDVSFDLGLTEFDPLYHDLGHSIYRDTGVVTEDERVEHSPFPFAASNDWGVGVSLAFSSDLIPGERAPEPGRISGMVTDMETGAGLAATLSFPGTTIASVQTDPVTGYYSVSVGSGTIPITVEAEGYQPGSATVVIEADQSIVKDFMMRPVAEPGMVTGVVTDSETGDPLVATISVPDLPEVAPVTSGADGVYQISVPAGTWTIKCEAADHLGKSLPAVINAGQSTVLNFDLRPALVQGQVLRFNNIYFDVASANIKPESYPVLDQIVATLLENPNARVQIAGHTDSDGSNEYNQTLSEQRAASVFNYLVSHGVNARNLTTIGFGETQPVVPNTSSANKAQNRRIEFTVLSVN